MGQKRQKDYTTEDNNGPSTEEAKKRIRRCFFPGDHVSLQLEVVICSPKITSFQTFLQIKIKLSYYKDISDIDHEIHIYVLILLLSH